jgi:hypothetical protein
MHGIKNECRTKILYWSSVHQLGYYRKIKTIMQNTKFEKSFHNPGKKNKE